MQPLQLNIESLDGLKLHAQSWVPEDKVKAVVCLVHGMGEHSGRYVHVAKAFNAAGYAMLAIDLRGHGNSEGKRGHAPSYAALMDDIFQLLKQRRNNIRAFPFFSTATAWAGTWLYTTPCAGYRNWQASSHPRPC